MSDGSRYKLVKDGNKSSENPYQPQTTWGRVKEYFGYREPSKPTRANRFLNINAREQFEQLEKEEQEGK